MILAAGTTGTIIATVAAFLLLTLLLVALLLFVKQKLSPSGPVTITINGEKKIEFYNTNKDLLLIDYWRDKIEKRIGRKLIVEPESSTRVNIDPPPN